MAKKLEVEEEVVEDQSEAVDLKEGKITTTI